MKHPTREMKLLLSAMLVLPRTSNAFLLLVGQQQPTRYYGPSMILTLQYPSTKEQKGERIRAVCHQALGDEEGETSSAPLELDKIQNSETNSVDTINNSNATSCIRFSSPLLEFGYPPAVKELDEGTIATKPLLLYIPGFDGTFLSAFFQYPELQSIFEVRCLVSTMEDRSTLDELKESILEFLQEETKAATQETSTEPSEEEKLEGPPERTSFMSFFSGKRNPPQTKSNNNDIGRPVYLVGESFGGILAPDVALALLEDHGKGSKHPINLQGLVLINAATCYDRSRLAAEGPPLIRLPKLLYVFGILRLLPMFLDEISLPQLLAIVQGNALPSLIDSPSREAYMGRFALSLPFLLKFMPQETFQWRLEEWLKIGCRRMETTLGRLSKIAASGTTSTGTGTGLPTLIVAGENDLTLPSLAEAERLAQFLPNSHVHVVPGVGHANTCGTCLDLAAEMRSHFPELQTPITPIITKQSMMKRGKAVPPAIPTTDQPPAGRTAMKETASQGKGIYYGMEPRYDGKKIGLSPLLYWSKDYYKKARMPR